MLYCCVNRYPPNTAKCALAEAIIQEFPTLRDQHAVKGYVNVFKYLGYPDMNLILKMGVY